MSRPNGMTCLVLAILLGQAVAAAGGDALPATTDDANEAQIEKWIRQLGSEEFQHREAAAVYLKRKDLAAQPALQRGLKDPDLEIRLRCSQILSQIEASDLDRRLSAFIDDADGKQDHDLPAWDTYREYAGDDRGARKLFAEIFRNQRELLLAVDAPQQERESLFLARLERMQQEIYGRFGTNNSAPSTPELAVILLIAAQKDSKLSIHAGIQMYSYLSNSRVQQAVTKGSGSEQLKRLMTRWVANGANNTTTARYCLMVALQYDLKDSTLELARRLVAQKGISTSVLPYAVLAVGKYGDKSDVDLLDDHLDNKTVCHSWQNGRMAEVIKIEVRDVVLATLIHITGQDHKDYGFDLLQKYPQTLFHIYTCGFVKNEDREAAVTKWRKQRPS